ncbi:MAG TPA: M14 family zinc carboxypeptidase [Puia sp.]|nr:M14 family zinc carboxypeptidase [Puia sp.]
MRKQWWWVLVIFPLFTQAQGPETPFEHSGGRQTATYSQCIAFYQQLDKMSPLVAIRKMGMSDAGFPYHVVLYSNDGTQDPIAWHRQGKVVILINNGIHPGEPDGIDASMLLIRDLIAKKIRIPDNIGLAVIPIYNIGGALNRTSFSRVNQNGPESYGFRGNGQNLDLNRDFTKNDSRNARSFAQIFHWLDPDLQIDNHVSDGADYQYTMTLLSTQWNKLGGQLGTFLHDVLQPALFRDMAQRGWPMTPYVEFESGNPREGWNGFYDEPRYSSGYAALFHTIAFMPETHMLKPFRDRVLATYALMQAMIVQCSRLSGELLRKRKQDIAADLDSTRLALDWKVDRSRWDTILFKGYETGMKTSEVTGMERMYYDHTRPFERPVKFYTWFSADAWVTVPKAYVIPQAWHAVIDLLQLNRVRMRRLTRDSTVSAEIYHVADYRSYPRAYEKHHKNTAIQVRTDTGTVQLRKGDYIIATDQAARRFLVEMLEPTGEDSYFAWNFFDAVLQQKEGYSAYRWEDVAGDWLKQHPDIRAALEAKRQTDSAFAKNARAQLEFVYTHSPYYEPAHLRYPVYRIMK